MAHRLSLSAFPVSNPLPHDASHNTQRYTRRSSGHEPVLERTSPMRADASRYLGLR